MFDMSLSPGNYNAGLDLVEKKIINLLEVTFFKMSSPCTLAITSLLKDPPATITSHLGQ
jgi:hypothetical protein